MACVFQQLQINIASRTENKKLHRKTTHLNKNTDNKTMRNEQVKIKRIDASTTFCNYNVQLSCKLQSETERKKKWLYQKNSLITLQFNYFFA